MSSKSRDRPWNAGRSETRSTMVWPAVRKKGVDSEFPAESSIKDGSTKHTRNQRSYDRFC